MVVHQAGGYHQFSVKQLRVFLLRLNWLLCGHVWHALTMRPLGFCLVEIIKFNMLNQDVSHVMGSPVCAINWNGSSIFKFSLVESILIFSGFAHLCPLWFFLSFLGPCILVNSIPSWSVLKFQEKIYFAKQVLSKSAGLVGFPVKRVDSVRGDKWSFLGKLVIMFSLHLKLLDLAP